jgi:rhamnose utilization protein RhaD (predicted bifunctional aldolase and dehydrogenase)/NAD(P)-dependent dehydrogenase (short-subunit alcohol dehydrogenase family)
MKNLFDAKEAQEFITRYPQIPPDLALRIYTSRLIGGNPGLVLHGGGNTSVKLRVKNIVGEEQEILYIKGSGIDLAAIEFDGFVGLELEPLRKLGKLPALSDEEMENQLRIHKIQSSSPDPSVEVLLHAFLPHRYIDHTHADFILALTNQKQWKDLLMEALGPKAAVLAYQTPGLSLAKGVSEAFEANPGVEAVVVAQHGIFTFGEDARTAYERMMDYVDRAEAFIKRKAPRKMLEASPAGWKIPEGMVSTIARLNQAVRGACAFRSPGGPLRRFYTEVRAGDDLVKASLSPAAPGLCSSGVLTPDHVIRTKNKWVFIPRIPQEDAELKKIVKEGVDAYLRDSDQTFAHQIGIKGIEREKLDPYPRVFLAAGAGIVALGYSRRDARIAADIAEHTLRVKLLANEVGEYAPISEFHALDMEYWGPQQKKLGRVSPPPLAGQVAVITGAGGAIGLGIADRLLAAGAVVAISDIDGASLGKVQTALVKKYGESQVESFLFDVTDYGAVEKAFQDISCRVGGIDVLVPNAGVAHVARVEDLDPKKFDQVIAVNLKGTFNVIKAAIPIFRGQGTGGSIVVVSSKNVFDPGAAFGAYSASKAAAHQISKIAALELAEMGVRVNLVNPDAVFGDEEVPSKLWELIGPDRMKSRGLDPQGLKEYYRQRNLLKVSVTAEHVGNAVVFFATEASAATTGATLPVDGGIPAAFPR